MADTRGAHLVQFFEHDGFLIEALLRFLERPLREGRGAVVIATPLHRALLEARLQADGIPVDALQLLDADETLAQFMVDGSPDPVRFRATILPVLVRAEQAGRGRVAAFGEMVALLWARGETQAALDLEHLWEELLHDESFDLLCAYPLGAFAEDARGALFDQVCESHTESRPTETYLTLTKPEDLQREVVRLQQRERVLLGEVARRIAAEENLLRSGREKDQFLAVLAHELRNPLTPMVLSLSLARANFGPSPHFDRIERQTNLLRRLVEDLVDLSRLARVQLTLVRRLVPLDVAVGHGVELAQHVLEERGHALKVEVPPGILVDGDADRLAQVFGNLLVNAARYTPAGGVVQVQARLEDGAVTVEVSDNGEGFDPQLAQRFFDPFVQADPSRGGLGLGLAVVRGVVGLHGGTVQAASPGPGKGSTFTIRLPLPLVQPAKDPEGAAVSGPVRRRRVLVIDDNADVVATVAELLTRHGHEVYRSTDPASALQLALQCRPNVIVTDLQMPGIDGHHLARQVRARPELQGCVLVALSGHASATDRAASDAAGFDLHVAKPPMPSELLRAVAG